MAKYPSEMRTYTASSTADYTFLHTSSGTTDMWTGIRVPKIHVPSWETVEPPIPGGQILAQHLTEPIENLRKEFDAKLEAMMNQMMENVMKVVALLPRNGGEIPMREGVLCICGNFIPEAKKHEQCEYCGK